MFEKIIVEQLFLRNIFLRSDSEMSAIGLSGVKNEVYINPHISPYGVIFYIENHILSNYIEFFSRQTYASVSNPNSIVHFYMMTAL